MKVSMKHILYLISKHLTWKHRSPTSNKCHCILVAERSLKHKKEGSQEPLSKLYDYLLRKQTIGRFCTKNLTKNDFQGVFM